MTQLKKRIIIISMSTKITQITENCYSYISEKFFRETDILRKCREETASLAESNMQVAPEEGQFLSFLIKLTGAKKALEIGVFTGYSSLWIASAMDENGKLIACDVNEKWTAKARGYWKEAKVDHKIELRLAPAMETLEQLLQTGEKESFDMIFLDADKSNYPAYYEKAMELLSPKGILVIDNILWSGEVANPKNTEPDTEEIRLLNNKLKKDDKVDITFVPMADGIVLVKKKEGV